MKQKYAKIIAQKYSTYRLKMHLRTSIFQIFPPAELPAGGWARASSRRPELAGRNPGIYTRCNRTRGLYSTLTNLNKLRKSTLITGAYMCAECGTRKHCDVDVFANYNSPTLQGQPEFNHLLQIWFVDIYCNCLDFASFAINWKKLSYY